MGLGKIIKAAVGEYFFASHTISDMKKYESFCREFYDDDRRKSAQLSIKISKFYHFTLGRLLPSAIQTAVCFSYLKTGIFESDIYFRAEAARFLSLTFGVYDQMVNRSIIKKELKEYIAKESLEELVKNED